MVNPAGPVIEPKDGHSLFVVHLPVISTVSAVRTVRSMSLGRREFLFAGAGAAALAATGCAPRPSYPSQSEEAFEGIGPYPSGVGSGDPLFNSVLLWTRVHPERDRGEGIVVDYEVARSEGFAERDVMRRGSVLATGARDHCLTIEVGGLEPATTYWYRFVHDGLTSRIGRTRTAPAPDAPPGHLRLAAFSCQRWTHGYFTSHHDLASLAGSADTDLDLVLCLGDYVYETGYADRVYVPGRDDPIQDARSLDQFRSKYRMYRSDPDLQDVHALFPMVNVFDNHDGSSEPGDAQAPGAIAAFFEHLPVRSPDGRRIHRRVPWGQTADIFMTDQRQYRDPTLPEAGILGTSTEERPEILGDRTMLGHEQRDWLINGLVGSDATWKVIGSQLMFWPWRSLGRFPWQPRGAGIYLNLTQWDGYVNERLALLDALAANDVRNTVIVSGDSHVFSAAQVAPDVDDPASLPRVIEFGTGSVSSNNADESGLPGDDVTFGYLQSVNPNHLRYMESERHGYVVVDLDPTGVNAEMRSPRTIREPVSAVDVLARFRSDLDSQRLDLLV